MRSTHSLLVLLLAAIMLTVGCSPSKETGSSDESTPKPASGGWASDQKPKALDVTLPEAGDQPAAPAGDDEPAKLPAGPAAPPLVEGPAAAVDYPSPPQEGSESGPVAPPSAVPPADAFAPAVEPTSPPEPPAGVPSEPVAGEPQGEVPRAAPSSGEPEPNAQGEPQPAPSIETPTEPEQEPSSDPVPPSDPAPPRNPLRDPSRSPESSNPMRQPGLEPQGGAPQSPPGPTAPPSVPIGPAETPPPAAPAAPAAPAGEALPEASTAADTANPKSGGKKGDSSFDPVKENGPIFVGWPKPKLALVVTGREDGYIEPCGCAGLDRMKGGLSRRHTMVKSLAKKGWPVVCVNAGGLVKTYGRQTEIKYKMTVEAMRKIGFDAIGFGEKDLRLPAAEVVAIAAKPSPFVSANVGLFGFDAELTSRVKIVEAGGLKVGITAVLGAKEQELIKNSQMIELASPEEALAQVLPELKKECNLLVLLAHATKEESIALGRKFPEFQLVVTTGGNATPPAKPMQIPDTKSLLLELGEKGMDAIVVGLYDDPKQPLRYQSVPLDSRFAASKDMYRIMVAYQNELKDHGLEGLGVRPVSHPQSAVNGAFVGSERCKSCHEESYRIWKKSGHAKAWSTLVENDPPRNFDPECISCHVTGWHPTKYFPYTTGFLSEKQTPEMINVGCESCHGPGGAHCDAEDGSDFDLQERLYKAIRVTKEEAQTNLSKMCQNCHDLDNSPDFDFETYWPKVEHYEDEDE